MLWVLWRVVFRTFSSVCVYTYGKTFLFFFPHTSKLYTYYLIHAVFFKELATKEVFIIFFTSSVLSFIMFLKFIYLCEHKHCKYYEQGKHTAIVSKLTHFQYFPRLHFLLDSFLYFFLNMVHTPYKNSCKPSHMFHFLSRKMCNKTYAYIETHIRHTVPGKCSYMTFFYWGNLG